MRSYTAAWILTVLVATASSLLACAPAEDDKAVGGDEQNITQGDSTVESPVVFLFEGASSKTPKCAGALIGPKVAVTAKGCAEKGMLLGRAAVKDGKLVRSQITAVHAPQEADSDIAVVEIEHPLGGVHALITHAPLRDGYTVNGVAADDGERLFDPKTGEAASVGGRLVSETEKHSALIPDKGAEICEGDIGAPVCSSKGAKIGGINVFGTCGLAGIIVGPPEGVAADKPANGENAEPSIKTGTKCSASAWKVAQLGRHADFLRRFAPEAFKPLTIDLPVIRHLAYVPPGLWGHKTNGKVAECKIETASLDPVAVGAEAKVTAKVSFEKMQSRSAPYARLGIAPKSAPTAMRWLPASTTSVGDGESFSATFEGTVAAAADGDYIVAVRASATGGEEWTQCDTDGIENGFSADKALALKVGNGDQTAPQSTPPAASGSEDVSDPVDDAADEGSDEPNGEEAIEEKPKATSKAKEGGCSASPRGTGIANLPLFGLLIAGASLVRRRRH